MRLWLLSHLTRSPGNGRILRAARDRGHDVALIDPTRLGLVVEGGEAHRLAVFDADGPLDPPDIAFCRMGGSAPPAGFDAVHQLEAMGVPVVSRVAAVQGARDKIRSAQLLARAGLPLPATAVVGHGLPDLERLVEPLGPPPWIVKLPEGAQGMGVARVDSLPSLRTVVDMLQSLGQRLLVQHYVREASGLDIRVLVVGGQALAAMRRQSAGDEIRSNLHRGGTAEGLALTPQLTEIAVRAAEALGLDVAGVDMLPSRNGPVVAEVNGSPGLEGLEQATGVDLASEVVAYLERRNAAPGVDG